MKTISVGKEVTALARQMRMLRNKCLKEAGCEVGAAHFHVFMAIAKNEGCSEKQIAHAVGSEKTLVTKAVKKLTHQGLVESRRDDKDARIRRVRLTQKGWAELSKVSGALARITDTLSQGIEKTQIEMFLATLKKMQQNVSESLR